MKVCNNNEIGLMAMRLGGVKILLSGETNFSPVSAPHPNTHHRSLPSNSLVLLPPRRLGASPGDSKDCIIKVCYPMQDIEAA